MRIRQFKSKIWLPVEPQQIFPFFADARNLNELTPPWLNFRIVTPQPIDMKAGTRIEYKLKIRFVPVRWQTHIKVWRPPHEFVDEQMTGPYKLWVHRHTFETFDGGTLAGDEVTYATPLDSLLHRRWVRPDIETIFAFRTQALKARFGKKH